MLEVLVVEDNLVNQEVAIESLLTLGFECAVVENGALAVEILRTREFDLILMDCSMPVMDGYEATRIIRQQAIFSKTGQPIPIIALTAHALNRDEEKCLAAGMDEHLRKPFALEDLEAVIGRWTGCVSILSNLSCHGNDDVCENGVLDLGVLRKLSDGRTDKGRGLIERVVSLYLTWSMQTATDLKHALAQMDVEQIGMLVDALVSPSANIGALELTELCRALPKTIVDGDTETILSATQNVLNEHTRVIDYLVSVDVPSVVSNMVRSA